MDEQKEKMPLAKKINLVNLFFTIFVGLSLVFAGVNIIIVVLMEALIYYLGTIVREIILSLVDKKD